jgi:ACT domain-containing protein
MTDSKYFTTTKKGEIFELKSELNNDKKEKKREAVKKASISDITVYLFSNNFPFKAQQLSIFL